MAKPRRNRRPKPLYVIYHTHSSEEHPRFLRDPDTLPLVPLTTPRLKLAKKYPSRSSANRFLKRYKELRGKFYYKRCLA